MKDNGAHSFTEGMEFSEQPANVSNEGQPHVAFLERWGYTGINGSNRYFLKGGVFVSLNRSLNKCTILRVHPLRPEVFQRDSQFNVVYRGNNPWKDMAFAESLWRNLGLHIPRKKKENDLNVDDILGDMELLLKF